MKGIIFNLLEEVIRQEYGEDTWDSLLEAAGLDGIYTSLGSYGDEELIKLVDAASTALNTPPDQIIRWFGRNSIPLLAERYPQFFEAHATTRSFILTLNDIIHPEVRKIYPGAQVPVFEFDTSDERVVEMSYESPRKLCALAEGMIEGAAAHYGEEVTLAHPHCMLRGDERCWLTIAFQKSALAA